MSKADKLLPDVIDNNTEGGVLASLWNKIIRERGLASDLRRMVNIYVARNDITNGRVKNVKTTAKSTLIKNIGSKDMTWKVFLGLIFDFLGAKRLDISIKVTMANGSSSVHGITVNGKTKKINYDDVDEIMKKAERKVNEGSDKKSV